MLAGVGGRTVAEAKANISHAEVQKWSQYLKENGGISVSSRMARLENHVEYHAAKICWAIFRSVGAKDLEIKDLLPTEEVEEKPATLNDVMAILRMARKK